MKRIKVFVEGVTDAVFIQQYVKHCFNKDLGIREEKGLKFADKSITAVIGEIQICNGYTNLAKNVYINELKKNTQGEGINLVIFDADADIESRRKELLDIKQRYNVEFELFLFPNDSENGAIERMLEKIINQQNKPILDSWYAFENDLKTKEIPWKTPKTPTTPADKTKIYAYLETLVGDTKTEKERIKDRNRIYTDSNHWNLECAYLEPLKDFLRNNLL